MAWDWTTSTIYSNGSLTVLNLEVVGSDQRSQAASLNVVLEVPGGESDTGHGEVRGGTERGGLGVKEDDVSRFVSLLL